MDIRRGCRTYRPTLHINRALLPNAEQRRACCPPCLQKFKGVCEFPVTIVSGRNDPIAAWLEEIKEHFGFQMLSLYRCDELLHRDNDLECLEPFLSEVKLEVRPLPAGSTRPGPFCTHGLSPSREGQVGDGGLPNGPTATVNITEFNSAMAAAYRPMDTDVDLETAGPKGFQDPRVVGVAGSVENRGELGSIVTQQVKRPATDKQEAENAKKIKNEGRRDEAMQVQLDPPVDNEAGATGSDVKVRLSDNEGEEEEQEQ